MMVPVNRARHLSVRAFSCVSVKISLLRFANKTARAVKPGLLLREQRVRERTRSEVSTARGEGEFAAGQRAGHRRFVAAIVVAAFSCFYVCRRPEPGWRTIRTSAC